jgi:hypothetical protein
MRSALLAFVLFAGCTPDADGFPVVPGSTTVTAAGGPGGFGDDGTQRNDAGLGNQDGDGDGGIKLDASFPAIDGGPILDGPPADAAGLLPDADFLFP